MRISVSALLCCLALSLADPVSAQQPATPPSGEPLRIGVLTDMSGTFADISGPGAAVAVNMAAEDFGGQVLGRSIEVLVADHQKQSRYCRWNCP